MSDDEQDLAPDRTPPHDEAAEQAILGACLIGRSAIDDARAVLATGQEWYVRAHALLWRGIVELADAGTAVDLVTLSDALRQAGTLEAAGGLPYVVQLASEAATTANATYHARIVRNCWQRRRLIELTRTLERQAFEGGAEIDTVVQQAEHRLVELSGSGDQDGKALAQVLEETIAQIEQVQSRPSGIAGLRTGFPDLDRMTGGLERGALWVIAARPAMGKTSLGLKIADRAAVDGHRVQLFTTEMPRTKVAARLLAMRAKIPAIRLATGGLTPVDWNAITKAAAELAELPVHIDDRADLSVPQIAAAAAKRHRHEGVDLVIIDHIGELVPPKANSREQEVTQIIQALKRLARRLDVPVIAMSQLSRAVESRTPPRPELHDLRDSGAIEQSADVVLFIYRPEYYRKEVLVHYADGERLELPAAGLAELIVAKDRGGELGSVLARWDGALTSFTSYQLDTRHLEVPWESTPAPARPYKVVQHPNN